MTCKIFSFFSVLKVVMNSDVRKKAKSLFFNHFVLKQIAFLLNYSLTGTRKKASNDLESEVCDKVQNVSYKLLYWLGSSSEYGILYHSKDFLSGLEHCK